MKDNIIDFKDHRYEECLDFISTGIMIAENLGAAKLIEIVHQILSIVEDIEKD